MQATMWSKANCPFCNMALNELKKRDFLVDIKRVGENGITKEDLLKKVPDARTVPQIFIEDVHIGGYTELMKYFTSQQK